MDKLAYRSLNDQTYDRIKQGLMAATFRPGETLVIRTLAASFGVSATPVREALQRLVAERLLVMKPNRSIAVPELELDAYVELLRIRCELEGLAADLAAHRVDPAGLERLRSIVADIDVAVEMHDHAAYRALNQTFHFALYDEARSPRLVGIIQDLWGQTGPYVSELFVSEPYGPEANREHKRILRALEGRDGADARDGLVADITIASRHILPQLLRMGAERSTRHRRGRPPAKAEHAQSDAAQ
ncbi:GntR family transcriptional regulator [Aurantimonas sp. 22II-16-19i]|uniref:GntR family transcriptional regulator n=1 Tax=Aurantimonas sp. 22II-16-19i TaxID=1317114 RepID=UPI0009F7B4AE|nr:GntR family transcriptional regulator [Aurantimonas sp. 22II-16-19i]ORE91836.1 transcriptional regulator [Aurantimonas sp. 22II-16-19i]